MEGRYHRQIILPEVGEEGQKRLARAGVLVVGVGGLGTTVGGYLAAAGVGRLGIIDGDRVELSNLHRQILHSTADVGRPKVVSAKEKLIALNPEVVVEAYHRPFTAEIEDLVAEYDLVVAAVDDLATRYRLNAACYRWQKPLVEGAVGGFFGRISGFSPPAGPCYRCLFPAGETLSGPVGVIGTLPGVIATLMANEVLRVLLGFGSSLHGRVILFDALRNVFSAATYERQPDCPICR